MRFHTLLLCTLAALPMFGQGFGGFGGQQEDLKLVSRFDKNGDGWLNKEERQAARAFLKEPSAGRGFGDRPRSFGGWGRTQGAPQPGPKLSPTQVKFYGSDVHLYAPHALRTLFLEFENTDWEKEMAEFKNTDVEIPVKLTVDGKTYKDVGVHFHGATSFMMVGEGRKRSLVLTLDMAHKEQNLGGYHKLLLLNAHEDPSFLRSMLAMEVARGTLVAPKANHMRVVINGESWGVYVNQQHFNKDFMWDNFRESKLPRWKVPGSPNGHGGLEYLGDDPESYRRIYEIKSKDDPKSWASLIKLCRILNETPSDNLEKALEPLLDIDGTLRFLAWDNALVNGDGFYARASDYSLAMDGKGRFHLVPYDANETFSAGGGGRGGGGRFGRPGGGEPPPPPRATGEAGSTPRPEGQAEPWGGRSGGFGRSGVRLDPLVAANDTHKPVISKLLAVPTLKKRYLEYVRELAEKWLDWNKLGPIAQKAHDLIAEDVKTDTRKLDSTEAFERSLESLKTFAERRRAFLLGESTGTQVQARPTAKD